MCFTVHSTLPGKPSRPAPKGWDANKWCTQHSRLCRAGMKPAFTQHQRSGLCNKSKGGSFVPPALSPIRLGPIWVIQMVNKQPSYHLKLCGTDTVQIMPECFVILCFLLTAFRIPSIFLFRIHYWVAKVEFMTPDLGLPSFHPTLKRDYWKPSWQVTENDTEKLALKPSRR